jgi:hypothetical protein
VRFVVGDVGLGSGDGLLEERVMAAVAANESATKSRRIRRKIEQNVAEGKPNGGANRPSATSCVATSSQEGANPVRSANRSVAICSARDNAPRGLFLSVVDLTWISGRRDE